MTTVPPNVNPNAPLKNRNDDLEENLEKNYVNIFNNSVFNNNERVTLFEDNTQRSKAK